MYSIDSFFYGDMMTKSETLHDTYFQDDHGRTLKITIQPEDGAVGVSIIDPNNGMAIPLSPAKKPDRAVAGLEALHSVFQELETLTLGCPNHIRNWKQRFPPS